MTETVGTIVTVLIAMYVITHINLSNDHMDRVMVARIRKQPDPPAPTAKYAGCMLLLWLAVCAGGVFLLAGILPPELARMLLPK